VPRKPWPGPVLPPLKFPGVGVVAMKSCCLPTPLMRSLARLWAVGCGFLLVRWLPKLNRPWQRATHPPPGGGAVGVAQPSRPGLPPSARHSGGGPGGHCAFFLRSGPAAPALLAPRGLIGNTRW
jgi:hypothetical protein